MSTRVRAFCVIYQRKATRLESIAASGKKMTKPRLNTSDKAITVIAGVAGGFCVGASVGVIVGLVALLLVFLAEVLKSGMSFMSLDHIPMLLFGVLMIVAFGAFAGCIAGTVIGATIGVTFLFVQNPFVGASIGAIITLAYANSSWNIVLPLKDFPTDHLLVGVAVLTSAVIGWVTTVVLQRMAATERKPS